jgi:predicted RNA methylase
MVKGKNYANRKPESERPEGDFYPTPSCMVKELLESDYFNELLDIDILDPCCGKYAIGNVLRQYGFKNIIERDLMYGQNFLYDCYNSVNLFPKYHFINYKKCKDYEIKVYHENIDAIVMNPPFKEFNGFVEKAKSIADRVYCIGKMNFFGAHDRNVNGLWEHLEWVLPFDRQIAFDIPEDENGKVECGMIVSCFFIWNKNYNGEPKIKVLDMQKYIRRK